MKDFFVAFVEFFFESISNKDYTIKEVLIVMLKIVVFLLILFTILYFLLIDNDTIAISD